MSLYQDLSHGITTIDTGFLRPGLAACYLLIEKGKAALVDTGTTLTAPQILKILSEKRVAPQDVEYVFVTHVHLDHAGGAGKLMQCFPSATCVVHPRGAKHLIDPTKLVSATTEVFGEHVMRQYYGPILPVPATRVMEIADNQVIDFHGRSLIFIYTEGHARHHYCIFDAKSQGIFTGDTFGVSYREFDSSNGAFILPATTPTQFDPQELHASIDRFLTFKPKFCYLTHFGAVTEIPKLAQNLHVMIDEYVKIALSFKNRKERHAFMVKALMQLLLSKLKVHDPSANDEQAKALLLYDTEMNAQGLESWLERSP